MTIQKIKQSILLLATLISFFFSNISIAFPKNDLRPGGIVVINIAPSNQGKPKVTYESDQVALVKGAQNWLAVVGIPLSAKAGSHQVKVTDTKGRRFR